MILILFLLFIVLVTLSGIFFPYIGGIAWPLFIVLILYYWFARKNSVPGKSNRPPFQLYFPEGGLPTVENTFSNIFIVSMLFIFLLALGERVLYDLARAFVGTTDFWDYYNDILVIMLHAAFVAPLLAVVVFINIWAIEQKKKFAVVLLPYYVATVFLVLQLVSQISVYFYNHHTDFQFYLVMSALVLVSSFGIYWLQTRFAAYENS